MRPDVAGRYRINRKSALILGVIFLVTGSLAASVFVITSNPRRLRANLKESAAGYIRDGQYRQAAIQLTNLVQLEPENADALVELGAVHLKLIELENPGKIDANTPIVNDRLLTALKCFQRAVAIDPDHETAQRWLLEFDLRVGHWPAARQRREVLARLVGNDPIVRLAWELIPSPHQSAIDLTSDRIGLQVDRLSSSSQTPGCVLDIDEQQANPDAVSVAAAVAALEAILDETPQDLDVLACLTAVLCVADRAGELAPRFAAARHQLADSPRLACWEARLAIALHEPERARRLLDAAARAPHTERIAQRIKTLLSQKVTMDHVDSTALVEPTR